MLTQNQSPRPYTLDPTPPLKIAVLGTRGFPNVQGGIEVHCENLYPELIKKGCEVAVLTRAPYMNNGIREYKGVKLISINCPKTRSLEAIVHTFLGLFAALRLKPDILHLHAIGPSLLAPLARLMKLKVVVTTHGPEYQRAKWGKFAKVVLRIGETMGMLFANRVIGVSKPIAEHIKKLYGRDIHHIPNGVVVPRKLSSDGVLKELGLKKNRYIFALGRFVPEKGFHDLIRGVKGLGARLQGGGEGGSRLKALGSRVEGGGDRGGDWKLVIGGRADHENGYSRGLEKEARNNKDIILTGFLTGEPLEELYSHAGLFVIPSYYEGLPIVLLEAMSYGLSCIASDIPANREVGLSEDRFFTPGDVEGLAEKIREFIDRPLSEEEKKRQIRMMAI